MGTVVGKAKKKVGEIMDEKENLIHGNVDIDVDFEVFR